MHEIALLLLEGAVEFLPEILPELLEAIFAERRPEPLARSTPARIAWDDGLAREPPEVGDRRAHGAPP